jgi:hypothetical protein
MKHNETEYSGLKIKVMSQRMLGNRLCSEYVNWILLSQDKVPVARFLDDSESVSNDRLLC